MKSRFKVGDKIRWVWGKKEYATIVDVSMDNYMLYYSSTKTWTSIPIDDKFFVKLKPFEFISLVPQK